MYFPDVEKTPFTDIENKYFSVIDYMAKFQLTFSVTVTE
jgi:hypothetical protein